MTGTALLLRGGRLRGHGLPTDLLIRDGLIAGIGPGHTAAETIDLDGRIVLPGFVDAHCHLDKTLWGGPWVPNTAGTAIPEKIAYARTRRMEFGVPSADRITALLTRMVAAGTTHVRTHTDVAPELGLAGFTAVRAAAERLAGRITVEQVAFPQYGLLTNPGTAELMEEALRTGVADVVGGIDPAGLERDPVRHLDLVFGLAERYGARVDLHLHDRGTLGAWELELIREETEVRGLQGRVTISHGFALGDADGPRQDEMIAGLAAAGISLATCASHSDPIPPVIRAHAAGVTLAAGNDGIRDLWSPYGDGDMLARAAQLAYRAEFHGDDEIELALDAATYGGARALGVESYGLRVGARADLVVVAARTPAEAVVSRPVRSLVLKDGRIVARKGEPV